MPEAEKKPKRKQAKPRRLSKQQEKLIEVAPSSTSMAEAGQLAGYANRQATYRGWESIKRKAPELLIELGYDQKQALADLIEMRNAEDTQIVTASSFGKISDVKKFQVPNTPAKLRARLALNEMFGHLDKKTELPAGASLTQVNINLVNASEDDLWRILELAGASPTSGSGSTSEAVRE